MSSLKKKSKEDIENNLIPEEPVNNIDKMPDGNIESILSEVYNNPPMKVMPTLPKSFKSLVNSSIDITNENRNPHDIIEYELITMQSLSYMKKNNIINQIFFHFVGLLDIKFGRLLGSVLGIDDYKTNVSSFWFLDFIALQVLQYESVLDSHGLSVMVSWLAGEMKLIQEKKLTREAFFRAMEEIFMNCSEKLSRGISLLHWDMMMINDQNNSEVIHAEEEIIPEPKEKRSSQSKISKRRLSSKSARNRSLSDDRAKFSENSSRSLKSDAVENTMNNYKDRTIPEVDATGILDVIIEVTYNMYGNRFHYALILAAFVKPVELHEYILPFTFRTPRPVKMYEVKKLESKNIGKAEDSAAARKVKEKMKTKDNKKTKKKSKDAETSETTLQPTPPILLTDEEILMKKREFILPLMEANEASAIIASYKEANLQRKNALG